MFEIDKMLLEENIVKKYNWHKNVKRRYLMELVLNSLKDILEVEKEAFDDKKSFFSILGRTYDEDLISRVISYVLKKDKKLIKNLIKNILKKNATAYFY